MNFLLYVTSLNSSQSLIIVRTTPENRNFDQQKSKIGVYVYTYREKKKGKIREKRKMKPLVE